MANAIAYIVTVLACVIAVWFVLTAVIYPNSSPTVPCEKVNFVANNTYYNTAESPIVVVHGIYDDDVCTNAFPVARWSMAANESSLRLYTNGTTAWPNITTGNHYVNYDYENSPTVLDMNFGFFVVLLCVAIFLVAMRAVKRK
jgi:hypothetical protein